MTARPLTRVCAGLAGAVIVALAIHVLMLAGVAVGDAAHAGDAVAAADHAGPAVHLNASPEHHHHAHLVADCMALVAIVGLAVLVARACRRRSDVEIPAGLQRSSPPRRTPPHPPGPPGRLLDLGVLLRV